MRNANDHINHLYLSKENNLIHVQYIGREAEIQTKEGFGLFLLPREEFFKINNIENEEDIKNITISFLINISF